LAIKIVNIQTIQILWSSSSKITRILRLTPFDSADNSLLRKTKLLKILSPSRQIKMHQGTGPISALKTQDLLKMLRMPSMQIKIGTWSTTLATGIHQTTWWARPYHLQTWRILGKFFGSEIEFPYFIIDNQIFKLMVTSSNY
jgi:hypothetical protein